MADTHLKVDNEHVDALPEAENKTQTESLPSLASVFKPEEFFEMDPIEEVSLSVMCCHVD